MKPLTNGQKIQLAYRQMIEPYSNHLQIAATLTLKQGAKIKIKRYANYGDECFEYWVKLSDDTLSSTVRYFIALLTHALYGNSSKHRNKQAWAKPLVIVAVEGKNSGKRTHLHLAIGNVPSDKLANIETLILQAWDRCDFGYDRNKVETIWNDIGWLDYISKEVGYTDNDALNIVASSIPQFIQTSICT
jgi:hypothetical protein